MLDEQAPSRARRAGVRLRKGDVALLRSGRWSPEAVAAGVAGSAGLHPSAAAWLHGRGIASGGDEGGTDLKPSVVSGITSSFHVLALVAMGMPLLENLDLERLAVDAAARSRWSFLFVAAPLEEAIQQAVLANAEGVGTVGSDPFLLPLRQYSPFRTLLKPAVADGVR